MILFPKVGFFLPGFFLLFAAGQASFAFAQDTMTAYPPVRVSVEQRIGWEREAIRQGFEFDISRSADIQGLSCLARRDCQAGVPSTEIQYARIQQAFLSGHCGRSEKLGDLEASFCQLLKTPRRKLFDAYDENVRRAHPESDRDGLTRVIAIALGHVKGGAACLKFVRDAVGPDVSNWTTGYYQTVVDCKLVFEGATAGQLETDLAYFRLTRRSTHREHCQSIKDTDIKAFCQGSFPTPLPDKP